MALILCIETSTTNCSVAVSNNEKLLSLVEEDSKNYSHAEQLHNFIEKALKNAKISKSQLHAIAVSKGPGSYTGLRIGVSSAKGLAYALGIPLISVSTLQSLAVQAREADHIISMIDARRMEVYTQTFNSKLESTNQIESKILDATSFRTILNSDKQVCLIGNGVNKFKEICDTSDNVTFISANPSAKDMVGLALNKSKQQLFEDVAYFEPFYLKEFVGG
jgi:tRNA threonylcarbamoyladenosine biosynthesis protein TsaB